MMLTDMKPAGPLMQLPDGVNALGSDRDMTQYGFRLADGTIVVRRFSDDHEISRFTAHGDPYIILFEFSADGKYLVSHNGKTVSVWESTGNRSSGPSPVTTTAGWSISAPTATGLPRPSATRRS